MLRDVSEPVLPPHVRARASYGPEVHAQAANLVSGHYLPVGRAVRLLAQLAGITVSTGWMAAVRSKAAALIGASGFPGRVRDLLRSAPALHADETPARAAGTLRYLHVACTRYLTLMHTGDRSAAAIDAGEVLPGYTGIIVRDGYGGYSHLTTALHAWCGAHLLRDLAAVYDTEPRLQQWAADMGLLLLRPPERCPRHLLRQPAIRPRQNPGLAVTAQVHQQPVRHNPTPKPDNRNTGHPRRTRQHATASTEPPAYSGQLRINRCQRSRNSPALRG
jgi:hypothetical protein